MYRTRRQYAQKYTDVCRCSDTRTKITSDSKVLPTAVERLCTQMIRGGWARGNLSHTPWKPYKRGAKVLHRTHANLPGPNRFE